jgi:hypothetical protein
MGITVPCAHQLSSKTGEYDVTDEVTSGGDIGAQVPIFPVVWVSWHRSVSLVPPLTSASVLPQLKGIKDYHGAKRETMTFENVTIERGWVVTSSNRREWLFVQDAADVSNEGKALYKRLSNLGTSHICCHFCRRVCCLRTAHIAGTCACD